MGSLPDPREVRANTRLRAAILRVTTGKGAMPAFAGQLTTQQIQDVTDYILASRGKEGSRRPVARSRPGAHSLAGSGWRFGVQMIEA